MTNRVRSARSLLAVCLLAWEAACSGAKAPPGYTKVDDMEEGGYLLEWPPPPGIIPGIWSSATDCTEAGNIAPPPYFIAPYGWSFDALPTPQETFPGVLSTHAARLRTTAPLVGVWGASLGFDMAELPSADGGEVWPPPGLDAGAPVGSTCRQPQNTDFDGSTVDLSAYSGVTFWAMADQSGATSLMVMLDDKNVDPRSGICNSGDSSNTSNCYNSFNVTIPLTGTLTRYTVDFSTLKQDPSWGYRPNPDVPDLHHAYGLAFQVNAWPCWANSMCAGGSPPPVTFDLWIDDIYFVNR